MHPISNTPRYSSLSYPTRVWIVMLLALILCFGASFANAASKPASFASQSSVIFDMRGAACPGACSFNAQMDPNGGSFGVSKDGDIAVAAPYGNVLNIYNAATGTVEVFPLSNVSGGTFDNQKNLFVGPFYKRNLYKLPYVSGDWVSGDLDAAPNCNATGIDTVMCKMPNVAGGDYNNNLDWKNAAFDSAGNLFMVTPTAGSGTAGGNKIYELTAANLYIGPPTLVYADDSTKNILSIAVDPSGKSVLRGRCLRRVERWKSELRLAKYAASFVYEPDRF